MEQRFGWNNQWTVPRPKDRIEQAAKVLGWFSIGLGMTELIAPGSVSRLVGLRESSSSRSRLRFSGLREIAAGVGILSRPRSAVWLWGRVAGDLMDLAMLGAAMRSKDADKGKAALVATTVLGIAAVDFYFGRRLGQEREKVPNPDILMY